MSLNYFSRNSNILKIFSKDILKLKYFLKILKKIKENI